MTRFVLQSKLMDLGQQYIPIQTLDVEAEQQITFDLYLNLPLNQRVLLYRRKGGQIESEKIKSLHKANVTSFLIRSEEHQAFIQYVANRLGNLLSDDESKLDLKQSEAAARAILSSTFRPANGRVLSVLLGNLNQITGQIIETVLEKKSPGHRKLYQKLVQVATRGGDMHVHPINVTSLAVLISVGVGYGARHLITDVAMGALLHDLGLSKLPARLVEAAHEPLVLPKEERRELYRHPQYAIDILDRRKVPLNESVRAIILQHHEQYNGFGYPMGLRGSLVSRFAQIVRVADELDHLARTRAQSAQELRTDLTKYFTKVLKEKSLEPDLASRIRDLFLEPGTY